MFGKRLDAKTAHVLGLVDKAVTVDQMMSEAKDIIKLAHGKKGLAKDTMLAMKKDIYIVDSNRSESRKKSHL